MAAVAEATRQQERPEGMKDFTEIMDEVAALEPQQQEKVALFVQGFVAATASRPKADKAAI